MPILLLCVTIFFLSEESLNVYLTFLRQDQIYYIFLCFLCLLMCFWVFYQELQVSHILNNDASPDERSVTILLTFLASQLLNNKKLVSCCILVILLVQLLENMCDILSLALLQDKVRKLTSRILEDQKAEIKVLTFSQMSFSGNGSPVRRRSQGNKLLKCASEQNGEGFGKYTSKSLFLFTSL